MILNYKDVDIYQDEHLVLGKVNFCVKEGEMVYLTGPVGSGKSSLLKYRAAHDSCSSLPRAKG